MMWTRKQPKSYYDNKGSKKRLVINQGGTRSGKTYSILQVLCEWCEKHKGAGWTITIVRKTLPALKGSAYRDFLEILETEGWYSEAAHNKSEMSYSLFGNLFEFISVDQPQKIRGRKRNICFINEGNELSYEDYFQLDIRTTDKMIIDFNPSDEYHWLYDLAEKEYADFFVSNYTHNPKLPAETIEKIERLKEADDNYWKVYGLGERGIAQETIYTHWQIVNEFPAGGEVWYGMDFGYNNPSSIVKVSLKDEIIYAEEMLYETKLTTSDLIERMKALNIGKYDEIFADCAEPKTIEEIYRAGFNIKPSDKDVTEGIRKVKSYPLRIIGTSDNMIKEIKNYKWKVDKQGKTLDEPVKFNDHSMDALRYAVFTKLIIPQFEIAVA